MDTDAMTPVPPEPTWVAERAACLVLPELSAPLPPLAVLSSFLGTEFEDDVAFCIQPSQFPSMFWLKWQLFS